MAVSVDRTSPWFSFTSIYPESTVRKRETTTLGKFHNGEKMKGRGTNLRVFLNFARGWRVGLAEKNTNFFYQLKIIITQLLCV